MVLIDLDSLVGGAHDDTLCRLADGSPIPVATARRLACEANLIPVVLDGAGQALDVGSASRLATWAQRRALRAMYATCTIPNCHVNFDRCQIHHTVEWLTEAVRTLAISARSVISTTTKCTKADGGSASTLIAPPTGGGPTANSTALPRSDRSNRTAARPRPAPP